MSWHKIIVAAVAVAFLSCGNNSGANAAKESTMQQLAQQEPSVKGDVPQFSADSAFTYVAKQVAFGPRVPGSTASQLTAAWLVEMLQRFGAENISQQKATVTAYNGDALQINNISASFNPKAQKRVLLLSHWDSRPWADQEDDESLRDKPIDGANDGASGVGVILEVCRNAALKSPKVGFDVLFVDAEDYGARADKPNAHDSEDDWCLGTQYWVNNPTLDFNTINYAILLDMVGGKDAVFPMEYFSHRACRNICNDVWNAAKKAGMGSRFPSEVGNPIVDDHIYLMRAGIPAIDIIETAHPSTGSFNPTWHTHADNIDNIDPQTLKAVGQTLLQLLY